MDLTAIGQFRLPLGSEQWDIAHQNYNWQRNDSLMGAQNYTSTTRPTTALFPGRLIWETDTLKLMRYNGTGWDQVGGSNAGFQPQTAFVPTDTTYTNTTTNATLTALNVPLVASARYRFQGYFGFTGLAAADLRLALTGPTGATARWTPLGQTTAATADNGSVITGSYGLGVTALVGTINTTTELALIVKGWMLTSTTAGNAGWQFAQGAANATGSVVKAGSWVEFLRIA